MSEASARRPSRKGASAMAPPEATGTREAALAVLPGDLPSAIVRPSG